VSIPVLKFFIVYILISVLVFRHRCLNIDGFRFLSAKLSISCSLDCKIVKSADFATMPYTKEQIEDKLRQSLDASYVVCLLACCFFFVNPTILDSLAIVYCIVRWLCSSVVSSL